MNDKIILKWTDTKTVHFLYDNDRKFNRKVVIALRKPTYYLWRSDFSSQEEFEAERRKYVGIGFRVVTFQDGNPDTDIHYVISHCHISYKPDFLYFKTYTVELCNLFYMR